MTWSKEYAIFLLERIKWKRETSNIKVRDVVSMSEDSVFLLYWPIAEVIYVYSGADHFLRVVKIETATEIYNRPLYNFRKFFVVEDVA